VVDPVQAAKDSLKEGKKFAAAAVAKAEAAMKIKIPDKKEEVPEQGPMESKPVRVPEKMIGRVIGPKGATMALIKEKTELSKIDSSGEVFTLMGTPKAVALAEAAIQELVEKGYTSLAYENFGQTVVKVHPKYFPELIGKQGAVIKKFKEALQVEVGIPEGLPKDAVEGKKKYNVTLVGETENVEKAKEAINEILMVYHSELTHPGQVHEEIVVEPWQLNFLIGKRGSEIKHIQNNYRVKLYISGENSVNEAHVIVGEPHDVERAKAYIEKLLWNAENKPSGREANSGQWDGDGWGDEEEQEEWMSSYIYKRRGRF